MVGGAIVAAMWGAAAAATAAGIIAAAAINLAVGFAAAYFMAKAMAPTGAVPAADYKQTVQKEKEAQRVIYGERQISMVMNFAEEQDGVQGISNKSGESHELLYLSGMICNHPVSSHFDYMLDDKPLDEYGGRAELYHVNGTGVIPSFLLDEATQYEADMTGSEGYWIALKLTHDTEQFSGIPAPRITVQGKRILDVRTGEMVYSNNAALVIYDFYVNYMRVPKERLMVEGTGSFIDAANLCDERVDTGERRYTINGMFKLDQKPSDILNEMLKSCGGTLLRTGGLIGLLPAAWYGSGTIEKPEGTFTITESDIVGEVNMTPQEAMGDAVNIIQGTYVEPLDDWNEQDFEDVRDEAAIIRDGFEIVDDITYAFVTNAKQARRLCYLELNRRTAGGATEITMSPKGAYCRVGRVVELDLPQLGINGTYRVLTQTENDDLTFTITLQRDEPRIYDDSVGKPYSPPPILDTGGQQVPKVVGLQYVTEYNASVGNTIQGKLVWQAGSASTAKYLVQIIDKDSGDVVQSGETKTYTYDVTAVPQGNFEGRVRAVDSRGRTSAPEAVTWSVGVPDTPSQSLTEVENSNWSVSIIPNIDGGTPQGTLFEFWYLAGTGSYVGDAANYDENDLPLAKLVTTASSLNHSGLIPDRHQYYWVRSVNPYGKSDYIYIKTGTTKDGSLVTTTVEKLKAIEVESENWTPDEDGRSIAGYKLFSNATERYVMADGTELNNTDGSIDGLFVANNAEIKGHITAETMTFVDGAIPPEIDNSNVNMELINYALGAVFTGSNGVSYPERLADGLKGIGAPYTDFSGGGTQYIQADLGAEYYVAQTKVYFYSADGRYYHSPKVDVSSDGINWTTVWSAERSTTSGATVTPVDTTCRYMRLWASGNSANLGNHLYEWEILSLKDVYDDSWIYPDQNSIQIQGNYNSGASGWAIDKYGNCEFNHGVFRGIIQTSEIYSSDFFLQCVPLAYYYSYADTPLGTGNSVEFWNSYTTGSPTTAWQSWALPLRSHRDRNSPVVTASRARYATPYEKGGSTVGHVGYVSFRINAGNQYYQGHIKVRIVAYNANGSVYQDSGEMTVSSAGTQHVTIGGVTWDVIGETNTVGATSACRVRLPNQRSFSTDKTFTLHLRGSTSTNASFFGIQQRIAIDNTTD